MTLYIGLVYNIDFVDYVVGESRRYWHRSFKATLSYFSKIKYCTLILIKTWSV